MFRKKWKKKDLYYSGDPDDYARLVFRRYGRDGSYPLKRGHSIILVSLAIYFLIFL
jgi:hypothetical protein